ncbi:MAG: NADH-quinone oxidoreductase subunit NuoF [Planctomycetes bacterium]|nr:NADH-quinone oxidoreductase subunit NuoF [Planctomycetota bacterium]MCC7171197.1 NADH-quinone oxidoreductase subunit NuoF [Planctomycetota bacterium]
MTIALDRDADLRRRLDQLVTRYPQKRAALIPALHLVQDKCGWLHDDAVRFVAAYFDTTPADVLAVITFYDMFHRAPKGTYEIAVCRNLACKERGADAVVKGLERALGCREGETSADGLATLRTFECLGGCTEAPLVAVNWRYFRNVDTAKADAIVANLRAGKAPIQEPRPEEPTTPKNEIYLTRRMRDANGAVDLATYRKSGGYETMTKALGMERDAIIEVVKQSGLRGRGGAGFSTGMKWSFMPKEPKKPHYLAVNADESEPGTCKDRLLMERDPHSLLEGMVIACYAIRAVAGYIYIRGEYLYAAECLERAIEEARAGGLIGPTSSHKIDLHVHRGAGAYICGEETALMESLEGKRGHPRPKPPFPAQSGLWKSPTTVNNVETICNIPFIVDKGAAWFRTMGNEKSPGNLLYSVAGNVKKPGIFELPLGTTARTLIDLAGGMVDGFQLIGINPGGASSGFLPPSKLDVALDHDTLKAEGSMLGTGAITVVDQKFGMVEAVACFAKFFEHETCGQCGPCREGCAWASRIVERFLHGEGTTEDLDVLSDLLDNSVGKTICVFPEALAGPLRLGVKHFRPEFEKLVKGSPTAAAPATSPAANF